MPLHLIEDTNDSIGEAGKQKIRILTKTKIFRKKINFMKWECEYLGLKEDDVNEQYIDWQFLRVTNQLKMVISGSQLESDREKTVKSKLQLEKRREVHEKKIAQMEKDIKAIKRGIIEKKKKTKNYHIN